MDNSTAGIVKRQLEQNPLLSEYLAEGIINYSALARKLLPKVKKENPKARIESILIAIQRNIPKQAIRTTKEISKILSTTEASLTGDIMQLVFERTKETETAIFERMRKRTDSGICIITETRQEIALFLSRHFLQLFKGIPGKKSFIEKNLAVLGLHETTISRSQSSQYIPGYLAHLSLIFTQNNISIIELVSCHAQILIFVKGEDASRSYELLKKHIKDLKEE